MIAVLLMELLSIENLCLAAEATAVLLLLAFAWPESKKPGELHGDAQPVDWEPVKDCFLKSNLYRGLYLNQCTLSGATPAEPFPLQNADDLESHHSIPPPWQDRLTKSLNRNGFDSLLGTWLALPKEHREQSCVTMVVLNQYSDMVSAHGAMVTEQALQRVAKQLQHDVGTQAIVARYLPDRFAILHYASGLPDCCNTMAVSQYRIAEEGFFSHASNPLTIGCLISIASLGGESELPSRLEELEEGSVEAGNTGRVLVAKVDDAWSDKLVTVVPSEIVELERISSRQQDSLEAQEEGQVAETATPPEQSQPISEHETEVASDASAADSAKQGGEVTPSSDISAVANPDDIAALFSQINSNKSKSAEAAAASQPSASDSASDTASADDIAALFNAAKAKDSAAPSAAAKNTTPPPSKPINEEELGQAASADDIASLFAAAKATPTAQAPTAQAAATPSVPPPVPAKETASAKTEVDPTESASADDIAALFASMKASAPAAPTPASASKPAEAPAPAEAPKQTATPKNTETKSAAEDLNETASADDIASLFAKIKPTAPSQPASSEATSNESSKKAATEKQIDAPKPVEDLSSNASADDIASLFASAKGLTNSNLATAPVPASPAPPASQVTAETSDLSTNASADDIASLFASVKPAAKPTVDATPATPKATEPSATTDTPISAEELSGNASADDIASLFASVKPSMQKANGPSAPVGNSLPHPAQPKPNKADLSEAATSDDIASLFASVKSGIKHADDSKEPAAGVETKSPLPISEDQLGEVATADDIAMLFQTVQNANRNTKAPEDVTTKQEVAAEAVKPAPSPVVPPEELSSNASLDDIEALFAAMKK